MGRRMADTASHLVDNVFPTVPVRQWVLILPFEIRCRMSYDKRLISDMLAVFLRVVHGWYKRKAKELGVANVQGGSVSFLQKFGSSLNTPARVDSFHIPHIPARVDSFRQNISLAPDERDNAFSLLEID